MSDFLQTLAEANAIYVSQKFEIAEKYLALKLATVRRERCLSH